MRFAALLAHKFLTSLNEGPSTFHGSGLYLWHGGISSIANLRPEISFLIFLYLIADRNGRKKESLLKIFHCLPFKLCSSGRRREMEKVFNWSFGIVIYSILKKSL